ncbi:hypothetical protein R3Q06_05855 [Rhodococcus erythropolis]|uniref:hypothetical protein n=1 Tax=Rhodococcus erythropolis TaxID=1833 RepID=UPI002949C8F1|nr:hypothetical protein [Rhodococcus erythropolis]MDV6273021.1 hypothetical protein [Rhodococcus erythropolis]
MPNEQTDSKRAEKWTFALTVVSLIAGGTVVAGLVDRWSGSESDGISVAAATSVSMTTTPNGGFTEDAPEFSYVTPTAVYPTTIPGCESVEAPEDDSFFSYILDGSDTYDDPRFPWFSSAKAAAMSEAVKQALPKDIELKFASPGNSLQFGPISAPSNTDGLPEGFSLEELASTTASGTLVRDGKIGALSLMLHSSSDPIPACVAGSLVERRVLADQSVVDLQDTWSETNGVRTLNRSAMLYGVDGTRIQAYVNDTNNDGGPDAESSGVVPLTLDELATLVETPQLRITTPVPPGTAPLSPECHGIPRDSGDVAELDRESLERLNAVLEIRWRAVPPGFPILDAELGTLTVSQNDKSAACQRFLTRTGENESTLNMTITGGQPLPEKPNKYDPSYDGHPLEVVTRPDGSVIERDERDYATMPMTTDGSKAESTQETSRSVVVTRPNGTQVSVSSSAAIPNVPMTFEQLEFLATTDGLEIR